MTPQDFREIGKLAALVEYGIVKEAAMPAWLGRFGRGIKGVFRRAPAAAETAAATAKKTAPKRAPRAKKPGVTPDQMLGRDARPPAGDAGSEALRKQMMENAAKAKAPEMAAEGAAETGKGLLSRIPWWGKALGAGAAGYGAYRMLRPQEQQPQGMQPYFGPGTGAVDPRTMYPGY